MLATGRAAASFDNGQKLPSEPRPTLWSKFLRLRFMDLIVTSVETGARRVAFKLLCGAGFSLRPILIGLLAALASSIIRPIEIGRRLKPAPQAHAVFTSIR